MSLGAGKQTGDPDVRYRANPENVSCVLVSGRLFRSQLLEPRR